VTDGRDSAVEIFNVGQTETAGNRVEFTAVEDVRRCDVGVDVSDSERLVLLSFLSHSDHSFGNINAHHIGTAPGQLPGDTPVSAGNIKDVQADWSAKQAEQGQRDGVIRGIETAGVEVCDSVVPGLGHVPTVIRPREGLRARRGGEGAAASL
jgi:hypothetical protein